MNPQHKNPTRKERKATAPYNFVPLPDDVLPAVEKANELPDHGSYADATYKHTGYFEVKLTTLSPLYIRAGLKPKDYEQAEREQKQPPNDFREAMRNRPDFFNTGDPNKPVIPGSSLRGMLRQLVEIITYSKVKDVPDRRLVYRAVGDPSAIGIHYRDQMLGKNKSSRAGEMRFDYSSPRVKGGYLEQDGDGWAIRPAREELSESIVRVHYKTAEAAGVIVDGEHWHSIYVKPAARIERSHGRRNDNELYLNVAETKEASATDEGRSDLVHATLVQSGHMDSDQHPKHWHCAIYDPDVAAAPIPIPDELWGIYSEDRDMTRDKNRPTLKLRKEGDPLFYLVDKSGKLVYFGSTVMFRLVYNKRPIDLIPDKLRDPAMVDFAEALFGFVRTDDELKKIEPRPKQGEKGRAYAGRVSITNATLDKDQTDIWLPVDAPGGVLEPWILASPKPTSFQHDLTQSRPDDKLELDFYDSERDTVLRGFKMYWPKGNPGAAELQSKPSERDLSDERKRKQALRTYEMKNGSWRVKANNTQHTRMRPVRSGKTFTFRVYFENLSDVELGALEWALRLPGPDKPYCHRLGMGKPLGLGAVSLAPTLHLFKPADRYDKLLDEKSNWVTGHDDTASGASYTGDFERHVLGWLSQAARASSLASVERIQMLLKILEWRDPDPLKEWKQYMTDLRDFKARRVLPDPLHVGRAEAAPHGGGRPPQHGGPQGNRRGLGGSGRRDDRPSGSPSPSTFDKPKPREQKEITERESTEKSRSFADEFMEQLRRRQGGKEPE